MSNVIKLGDPVPWFDAVTITAAQINLGVKAGRWVVLCFLDTFTDPAVVHTLAQLLGEADLFNDDHMGFFGVVTDPPANIEQLAAVSHKALGFIADYNSDLTRQYDVAGKPCLVVLDPLLRVAGHFPIGAAGTPPDVMRSFLRNLPAVDDWAGVPLSAPALIVPNVFEREFCDKLIELYEENGGTESGFMLDEGGKTKTVVYHPLKSRKDFTVQDPAVREMMRDRIVRRLIPAIERFFQYRPTRMDRRLVSCYDTESGGHFYRHRDNVNAAARHRRFAVSINLNSDYEGCDLIFPEFGRRRYKAPHGGAIVFSTGALHEVLPITRGKRYAFVPFLYGEGDARERLFNNRLLQEGELVYTGAEDRLFPDK